MTENENENNDQKETGISEAITTAMSITTKEDGEPRIYLLVLPMENGIGVKPILLPKKVYISLVSKMNNANKVLAEAINNGEAREIKTAHKIMEAIAESEEGAENLDGGNLHVKQNVKWDRMFG